MSEARGERLRAAFENSDRPKLWPNQRPRDAATLIILDRTGASPRLLMGRRHHGHKFMPGKFVFPGGRLESGDRFMASASELRPETAERLTRRTVGRAGARGRALALAAIRETYEETGLLIGREVDSPPTRRLDGAWRPFFDRQVLPDLHAVALIGRAITPPRRPKRFDTRFFAVDRAAIRAEEPGFVGPDKELVELAWVDLEEAKRLDLPRITSIMLEELEHRIGLGFPHEISVPFYRELHGRFVREML